MTYQQTPLPSLAVAGILALACLTAPAATAHAAAATVSCTSAEPALADKLRRHITAALAERAGTVAVGVRDRTTGTTCTLRPDAAFDSASVVKVTVLATLLWDAQRHGRTLTRRESDLATDMITRSGNSATDTLWEQLGVERVQAFLDAAGMSRTVPNLSGYWGLTQINVRDQQRLLALLTGPDSVLVADSRAYVLDLMGKVVASQRWGTSAGAPASVSVHVKNGWLPRATYGWRVHSVGAFQGAGHDYTITVLTHGNSTMSYGVNTIQAVARAVHLDLVPDDRIEDRYRPTTRPTEVVPPLPSRRPGSS
ncbi:serine hydrolase [Streptomyces dysideae]|uniref:Beta-lactamase class A catalytic domain-containing protein n=1 Tax=Streptomyces dysideae TaxID=909626 RepID=A0A101V2G6_9ACTN|nr:serine hydrolase [Streptomyces dysideae]KUO21288.1 hypothetical protein AQJ91_09965 [Streptomyces dysideae]